MFGQGTTFVIFLFTLSQDDAQSEPTIALLRIPMDARKDEDKNRTQPSHHYLNFYM